MFSKRGWTGVGVLWLSGDPELLVSTRLSLLLGGSSAKQQRQVQVIINWRAKEISGWISAVSVYLWCLALLSCYFYVQARKTGSAAQTGSGSSALQPASERSRRCLGKVEHPFHALILTVFQIQFCLGCSCEWEEEKDKCPKYDKSKDVFYWLVCRYDGAHSKCFT